MTAPRDDELLFVPLGGSGEIGMNLNLYGHAGKWLMVDLGITFADESLPGVDVVMPDPTFIETYRDDLVGLVLTHAHEDHLGAVQYLWPRLRCPVYATPFTAAVLRRKLAEYELEDEVPLNILPMDASFELGPFRIQLITLTHSIPEPEALVIRTDLGTILHTGDWKLDPDPLVGPEADEGALCALGDEGVLAMVCDSTNALSPGHSGSEGALRKSLIELVEGLDRRVAIACFASNVARLETVHAVAQATGRQAALAGRSLWRMLEAAQETGYLDGLNFLSDAEAAYMPPEKVLIACTGSQGEPRSALARIAADDHPHIVLEAGDTVVFSSRIIPGNEKSIFALQNRLAGMNVDIVTEKDQFVHVSGHPNRDELTRMYQWVRPEISVPVHGELRHMQAHALLARECQVPVAIEPYNGSIVRLAPGPAGVIGEVPAGRLALDGTKLVQVDGPAIRERRQMGWNGAAVATLVVDEEGHLLRDPQLTVHGLSDSPDAAGVEEAILAVRLAVEGMRRRERMDDEALRETARRAVRRSLRDSHGKRPPTDIHIVRV
ncbi:MAG: ribonuclease J [Rhodospirillaceae bacterium]|jgi:ribonuclease J|nr:ribonuclease J [Rhodospirillaceae bacterium]